VSAVALYRYEIPRSDEPGDHRHPEIVIRENFPDATDLEPISIADCWMFRAEERPTPICFVVVREAAK
jgi:hypothetical protein